MVTSVEGRMEQIFKLASARSAFEPFLWEATPLHVPSDLLKICSRYFSGSPSLVGLARGEAEESGPVSPLIGVIADPRIGENVSGETVLIVGTAYLVGPFNIGRKIPSANIFLYYFGGNKTMGYSISYSSNGIY